MIHHRSAGQTRSLEVKVDDVNRAKRTVTSRINTAVVDRYRTVILPSGGDLANFQRTPAVLWEHGMDPTRGRVPIAHCTSVKYRRVEDDVLAVSAFKTDPYSSLIFDQYADDTLTSWSVDFLPDWAASSRATPEELRVHPDWAEADIIFRKWELTGYSAVSYPGNPEALTLAVERGLWVPDAIRRALPPRRTMGEGSGAAGGYVVHDQERGKFCAYSRDGEQIGEFDSEEEALAACEKRDAADGDGDNDAAEDTAERPGEAAERSLLAMLPAGLRSYTHDELVWHLVGQTLPRLLTAQERLIRDTIELDRGMV